jgi:hypothetical protein
LIGCDDYGDTLNKKIEKDNDRLGISTTENLCDTINVVRIRLSKH